MLVLHEDSVISAVGVMIGEGIVEPIEFFFAVLFLRLLSIVILGFPLFYFLSCTASALTD